MENRSPSIACVGIIGRNNNPLHISVFPTDDADNDPGRRRLEFSFMLNASLDAFEARMPFKTVGQDFGLLHALDERIALYGWLTNTGVKLVVIIDMEGRQASGADAGKSAVLGLRNSDLTPAFQALQTAYIRLLRNPFYTPDEHDPKLSTGSGSLQIESPCFVSEVERIGRTWYPGIPKL
ncbi:Sedlin [Polychaeton citri CBS 116435]|uniref:Sedlin n=1 Tax=Polychaeton citri CBS 116435 TaxID=1314669 RepID=A0A9P4Q0C4_9PEZI|nr:Sedlin [Polychaeton citri CBS 116435]